MSDDTMIEVLGGRLSSEELRGGGQRARDLATAIRERRLYHRALAFASRFVAGLEGFQDETTRDSERAALWRQVTRKLNTFEAIGEFEREIFETALAVAKVEDRLVSLASRLRHEHVIVDLPANKARAGGNLLLTRTENDDVGLPNLFFDPERWSNAYDQQKRCGYVFCPRDQIPLVSLASRIAIFRNFHFGFTTNADRFTKTTGFLNPAWIEKLAASGEIDIECYMQLREERVFLSRILAEELRWPAGWAEENPELSKKVADEIVISRPGGFISTVKDAVLRTVEAVAKFDLEVSEGSEVGGGETDLLVDHQILIENKIAGVTNNPMSDVRPYPFQARRYAIALCKTVFVTVVGYAPRDEVGVLRQSDSIAVLKVPHIREDCVELRFVVPYNTGRPSEVRRPRSAAPTKAAECTDPNQLY